MLESLFNTRGTYKNEGKVSLSKYGLRELKNEIKQMSENEIKSKRPDVIVNLVEKILDAYERQLDRFYTPRSDISDFETKELFEETPRHIPDLESEESAAQRRNQRGQKLKILTPHKCLVDCQFL